MTSISRRYDKEKENQPPDTATSTNDYDIDATAKPSSSAGRFVCPNCQKSFYHATRLIAHCEQCHQLKPAIEEHSFENWRSFLNWKEQEEALSHVYYVQPNGATESSQSLTRTRLYVCCRDGQKFDHHPNRLSKTGKNRAQPASRKLDDFCVSRMIVTEHLKSGSVEVRYTATHTNHKLGIQECKHLPLPLSVKKNIQQQFASGKSIEYIMDDIRGNQGNLKCRDDFIRDATRKTFITRQDCRNVCRKIRDFSTHRHVDDAISVNRIVAELEQESFSPVLLYKPQGKVMEEYPALAEDSFLVVLMTDFQASMMKSFSSKVICLDSTHKTNQYRFKLITMVVPDEYRNGIPVAWAISDREDSETIEAFFTVVKKKCPEARVCTLMTDDDLAGVLGCSRVYPGVRHLLCIWHVDRAWQRKLHSLITCQQHKAEVYTCLRMLMTEQCKERFMERQATFISYWQSREPQFIDYYIKEYSSRVEKWALCYRHFDHQDTDTNMLVESFHNKLKTNPRYMAHKVNRRCDDLIQLLLTIEEDAFYDRMRKEVMSDPQQASSRADGKERHERGKNIPDSCVQRISQYTYEVLSTSDGGITYTVYLQKMCQQQPMCVPQCSADGCQYLCRHMIKCTCLDYIHGHICKHAHKVNIMHHTINKHIDADVTSSSAPVDEKHDEEYYEDDESALDNAAGVWASTSSDHSKKAVLVARRHTVKQFISEISSAIDEVDDLNVLDRVLALLTKASASLTTSSATEPGVIPFDKKDIFSPAQKNETQLCFKKTTAKPGRKPQLPISSVSSNHDKSVLWDKMEKHHSRKDGDQCEESQQVNATPLPVQTSILKKRKRCGRCAGCTTSDCGKCVYCMDMIKHGGPGKKKKACILRKCQEQVDTHAVTQPISKSYPVVTPITLSTVVAPSVSNPRPVVTPITLSTAVTPSVANLRPVVTPITLSTAVTPSVANPRPVAPPIAHSATTVKASNNTAISEIIESLAKQKRKIRPILGDGNCLFRALGLIIYKSEFTHEHVRRLLVDFVSNNKACFQKYCSRGLTIEEHVGRIRYNRCWGTAIELLATASLFQIPVFTYSPAGSKNNVYRWIRYNPLIESSLQFPDAESYPKGAAALDHLELVHTGGFHYDCVVCEDGQYSLVEPVLLH